MARPIGQRGGVISHLAWLPLVVGAAVGVWWVLRRHSPPQPSPRRPGGVDAGRLLKAILGNDKRAIARVFGPPRASAGFAAIAPAVLLSADYLHADTWYYPLDRAAKTALVVRFDQGIAQDAQLVHLLKDG